MALPHIQNSAAGRNLYDPVHTNIFEVYFTLPGGLKNESITIDNQDITILMTEHVLKVSGLDALHAAPGIGQQKFMGTDRTYINPKMDSTHAEISIDFSLNLSNANDNYIYNIFRKWLALGYNVTTGERHLKSDYTADWMKICIGNRQGDIFHEIVFHDVMIMGGIENFGELNYDTADALQITVKFASDWWEDTRIDNIGQS